MNKNSKSPIAADAQPDPQLRIGVAIASIRRPDEIGQLLEHLSVQCLQPCRIVLSLENRSDAPADLGPEVDMLFGPKGLTAQRNRAIDALVSVCDVIVFFDDDFVPSDNALAGISALFGKRQDVIGATGRVLQDGITQGGISYAEALHSIEVYQAKQKFAAFDCQDIDELYGCNMAFRTCAVKDLRFDENLPLYGWQEDVDFAGQLLAKGRIVRTNAFAGVHRGVTRSRTAGTALGFSQMVNPIYMVKKGTMRRAKALTLMSKNFLANHLKSVRPEAYVDRPGRVRGNWLGLLHVITGKSDPRQVLRLVK